MTIEDGVKQEKQSSTQPLSNEHLPAKSAKVMMRKKQLSLTLPLKSDQ
ncbi:hypothetical protein [Neolewinella aurantiaca]|nr:hypothetical protein [Neolewinella aurantiaca]